MELFGFLFLLLIVLAAKAGSSSNHDEHRNYRGRYRDDHYRSANHHHHHDDYWDDGYDAPNSPNPYWLPPYPYRHRQERGSTGAGILLGFIFAIVLMSAVAVYTWDGKIFQVRNPPIPVSEAKDTIKEAIPIPLDYDEVPEDETLKPISPPKRQDEFLTRPFLICLAITDHKTFIEIQNTYPNRNIEAFLDKSGRYWVGIFFETPEELDQEMELLRLRKEDLKEHGLGLMEYQVSELCSGDIVREKGTQIWFCNDTN